MKDTEIFRNLFIEAKKCKDPEGAVAACLVRNGEIIAISGSSEDGIRHAEDLLVDLARENGIIIDESVVLVTTLEPCSYRSPRNNVEDCTTIILESGIKRVIYAASDPEFSQKARDRFESAGVIYEQVENKEIRNKAVDIFNATITKTVTTFGTDRKKSIEL